MGNTQFSKIPESDVVIQFVNRRLYKKGLGSNIFIIGTPGSGKSSQSLRLAEIIKKERDQVNLEDGKRECKIFLVDTLLDLIKAMRESISGDLIIIEEASVLFPSRRAMSKENVAIGRILDTCRKKELTLISNAPVWTSIESSMRVHGNLLIESLGVLKSERVVVSRIFRLQTNVKMGKTYLHTLEREGRDVERIYTRMPSKKLWEDYEKSKDLFLDNLYGKLQTEQEKKIAKENKDISPPRPRMRSLTKRELEVHTLLTSGLNQTEVSTKLGLSNARVSEIVKNIRKKGDFAKEN